MPSPHIRKQVNELTPEDFDRCPVWEYAMDEEGEEDQDEAMVRPYEEEGPLEPGAGMFLVRARLTLADGTVLPGYLTPPVDRNASLGRIQLIALVDGAQVMFWYGMCRPAPAELAESYAHLGKSSPADVFPLRFESEVELVGGPVTGEVPGFLVLEHFRSTEPNVIT